MSKWENFIDVVFGQNSDVVDIPNADPGDGSINNDKGLGVKYGQAIKDGDANSGLAVKREFFNALFKKIYSAVQEIQTKTVTKVNGKTPDSEGNVSITTGIGGYWPPNDEANLPVGYYITKRINDTYTLPGTGWAFEIVGATCTSSSKAGLLRSGGATGQPFLLYSSYPSGRQLFLETGCIEGQICYKRIA